MPKPTFFNLPEVKRTAFVDAAIDEFAAHDYETASISQIVARLGIAKGSLYQYFEDKRDLYLYLIEMAAHARITFAQNATPPDPGASFYADTQWLLELGVHFAYAHPLLNQLLFRAMADRLPFRAEVIQRMQDSAHAYIRQLLVQGIAAGEVNPSIDIEMAAYLLNLILNDFSTFLMRRLQMDPERLAAGDYAQLDPDAVRTVLTQAWQLVWFGLAARDSDADH